MGENTEGTSVILPNPPDILMELKDSKGDINIVADIVSRHESVAKEVLATINAPYFRLVRQIKNAEEAVRMLGINRVLNLTTGRLLRTTIFSGDSQILNTLWATSLKVAVIGVLISKELKLASTDEVYATSLFHNAGMGILAASDKNYTKTVKAAYLAEDSDISAFEKANSINSHAEIGADIADKWGLSQEISRAIRKHHSPREAIGQIEKADDCGELLLILKLSEKIARIPSYLTQSPTDHEWDKIKEPILDQLTLTEGMFNRFELVIKKQLAEIKN